MDGLACAAHTSATPRMASPTATQTLTGRLDGYAIADPVADLIMKPPLQVWNTRLLGYITMLDPGRERGTGCQTGRRGHRCRMAEV